MKLSIITINLNNALGLEKTIKSVINQTFPSFEFLVIDGASTDHSIKVIKQYEKDIDYWVSEPDSGIYQAMNKGILKSKGEYLLMLNSGDWLCEENILDRVLTKNHPSADIIYGNVHWESAGKLLHIRTFPNILTFHFFWKRSLGHQSTFIKRSVHEKVGLYDDSLRFSADWKFFTLSICKHGASYQHLPFIISVCDTGGFSWNPKYSPIRKAEHEQVLKEHFSVFIDDYQELTAYKERTLKNWISRKKEKTKSVVKKLIGYKKTR